MKKTKVYIFSLLVIISCIFVSCKKEKKQETTKNIKKSEITLPQHIHTSKLDIHDAKMNVHGRILYPRHDSIKLKEIDKIWEQDFKNFVTKVRENNLSNIEKDTNLFNFEMKKVEEKTNTLYCTFEKQIHFAKEADTLKEKVNIAFDYNTKKTEVSTSKLK
ncbi:MAG: hypothetical protein KBT03_10115 [Bacteroidales bacterium]|nr:hypothetical protein [Candidatus Scybalousia scybalohippi]